MPSRPEHHHRLWHARPTACGPCAPCVAAQARYLSKQLPTSANGRGRMHRITVKAALVAATPIVLALAWALAAR